MPKDNITLASILKDSDYNLSLFRETDIKTLESKIKVINGKPYINCIIREKDVQLKPEEIVRLRQRRICLRHREARRGLHPKLYTLKLLYEYGEGKPWLDKSSHLIVDHDLHNQGGDRLPDGIAEAFIDWAKKEKHCPKKGEMVGWNLDCIDILK